VEPARILPEEMPLLYRAVLDLASDLLRQGEGHEAQRIRSEAIHAYSAAWTGRQSDVLRRLLDQAGRTVEAGQRRTAVRRTP
jgi:hypothetical protein